MARVSAVQVQEWLEQATAYAVQWSVATSPNASAIAREAFEKGHAQGCRDTLRVLRERKVLRLSDTPKRKRGR